MQQGTPSAPLDGALHAVDDSRTEGREPARENPSEFCPVCHRRLAPRACKLICECGYYMSCSDYY